MLKATLHTSTTESQCVFCQSMATHISMMRAARKRTITARNVRKAATNALAEYI